MSELNLSGEILSHFLLLTALMDFPSAVGARVIFLRF